MLSKQQPYTEPRHSPEGCCWDKAWLALETGMESQELSSHMRTAARARHRVRAVSCTQTAVRGTAVCLFAS